MTGIGCLSKNVRSVVLFSLSSVLWFLPSPLVWWNCNTRGLSLPHTVHLPPYFLITRFFSSLCLLIIASLCALYFSGYIFLTAQVLKLAYSFFVTGSLVVGFVLTTQKGSRFLPSTVNCLPSNKCFKLVRHFFCMSRVFC